MKKLFKATANYYKTSEDGAGMRADASFMLDAVSHTEAEAILTTAMKEIGETDFLVKHIAPVTYSEVILCPGGRYFNIKAKFTAFDEASGKEKTLKQASLVRAEGIIEAIEALKEANTKMISPSDIISATEFTLEGVYFYEGEESGHRLV